MRPEFRYPAREFELWTPLYIPGVVLKLRGDNSYLCVARLKPGVTIEQARAHMNVLPAIWRANTQGQTRMSACSLARCSAR